MGLQLPSIRAVTPSRCPYLEVLGPEFVFEGFGAASVAGFIACVPSNHKLLVGLHLCPCQCFMHYHLRVPMSQGNCFVHDRAHILKALKEATGQSQLLKIPQRAHGVWSPGGLSPALGETSATSAGKQTKQHRLLLTDPWERQCQTINAGATCGGVRCCQCKRQGDPKWTGATAMPAQLCLLSAVVLWVGY